ncbi:hypothetical protein [Algiphilus aromaticivorans]|uniref:hypothetical protein n=1 Tax=Algiphilus aromaticivorans TaxID=382454 RepID=UPI000694904C|nr:hypothetical protein [Algiphilus aromaticivorans]
MVFRQLRDLLDWAQAFHVALTKHYQELAKSQPDARLRLALEFLAGREQRIAEAMAAYLANTGEGLLDTWLRDSAQFGHPSVLQRIPKCLGCADVHDVLANALTAHRTLQDMYRVRAELAQVPEEEELFHQLAQQQDAEVRLQARDLARLDFT